MKDKKIFFFQNLRTKKLFLDFKNLKNIRLKIGNKKQKNSILIYMPENVHPTEPRSIVVGEKTNCNTIHNSQSHN